MDIEIILPKITLDPRYPMSTMAYKKFRELTFNKSHKLLNQ